jgi:putative ABC transport system substrate-binding protein
VVTWGTSVTRGMLGSLDDTGDEQYLNDRPAVFMVVADPIGAGLIEGYDRTGRPNVTGTRNRVPEAVNINVIRSYQPDFRRLGMVFNRSERNSVLKVEDMRRLAEREGFDVVAIEVRAGTDGQPRPEAIAQALEGLRAAQVDFVYTGSSSFLRRHQDTFTAAAIELGLPVLSAYESMVRQSGALISVAARYRDVGRLAGEQVRRILVDGAVPGELPVAAVTDFAYVVNMETARRIRLLPPLHVLEIAETVH